MQQTAYQVRFGFGIAGVRDCASDADVIVWADALPDVIDVARSLHPAQSVAVSELLDGAPADATIVGADFATSTAVARWVLDYQKERNRRLAIAVIGASAAFAAEDFLCAGAVISALTDVGLDATSPEAATAEAAYRGLSHATSHLVSASVAGRASEIDPEILRVHEAASVGDVVVFRDVRSKL